MHRVTAYSDMTFLSCLEPPDPASWECYDVQLAGLPSGAGDMIYPASGGQPHTICQWTLDNVWFKPSGQYLNLSDHVGYTDHNTYLLTSADGTKTWRSATNQVGGGNGGTGIGASQGDMWTCVEPGAGLYNQSVRWGSPPADFCPADVPGVTYSSPGYA